MPSRRLRRSISSRTLSAKLTRRPDRGGAVLVGRLEPGLRVADRGAGDGQRLVRGRRPGRRRRERERPQVEVVDGLLDQVVEVLDQAGAGVGVAGDTQRAEHHRAELVGGRDRGGVESGEGLGDPSMAEPPLGVVAVAQQVEQVGRTAVVDGGQGGGVVAQRALGLHQLGAHPLAQLLAGGAPEGDHQHLLELGVPLGHEAGDQGADGPGLAGAGAGLEQGGAGRQRAADVERRQGAHSGPTRSAPVSSGSHTCQASSGSPASTSASGGVRGRRPAGGRRRRPRW